MPAEHEKKLLASKKHDPAITSRGFTYWKEATTAFEKHQGSAAHSEAIEALVLLPLQIQGNIGESVIVSAEIKRRLTERC